MGAELAVLDTRREHAFVGNYLFQFGTVASAWVGGRISNEGGNVSIAWIDGSEEGDFERPWLPTEPAAQDPSLDYCLLYDVSNVNTGARTRAWAVHPCVGFRAYGTSAHGRGLEPDGRDWELPRGVWEFTGAFVLRLRSFS